MPYVTNAERFGREMIMQEGTLKIVLRLVGHKFGPLEPALNATISKLSLEQLEDLSEALLDFKDQAELISWLQKNN